MRWGTVAWTTQSKRTNPVLAGTHTHIFKAYLSSGAAQPVNGSLALLLVDGVSEVPVCGHGHPTKCAVCRKHARRS